MRRRRAAGAARPMSARAPGGQGPFFVLSHPRTGSTLVRYVIDTHPRFCCPPELALGQLCRTLRHTIELTQSRVTTPVREQQGPSPASLVRRHVEQMMAGYCTARSKPRWCEKSTNNLKHLDVLHEVFPDAQYICLHRNCADVAASQLELFRHGFSRWYAGVVGDSPGCLVAAVLKSWIEATARELDFEAEHPTACCRLKYEDLVRHPEAVAGRIFAFLGEPFDAAMLAEVFTAAHERGPGDVKIRSTTSIRQDRVGAGVNLPLDRVTDAILEEVNALNRRLGYPPLEPAGR